MHDGCGRVRSTCLIEEKVYGLAVELERQGLQKRDIVGHYFFVVEVELVHNYVVYVVVGQQKVCWTKVATGRV